MREQLMTAMIGLLAFLAIGELIYALALKKQVHTYRDTLSSIALGIGQQAINIYLAASFLGVWDWIHVNYGVVAADMGTWWHWVPFILACDLSYYCAHRAGHTVNFWVAAHVVHHHAKDFNYLSSFRQSWVAWGVNFPFFLPLALFVPLKMFVFGQLGIMFLQFLSHNGVYRGRLGVLDRIFVTPANHRVHHGLNQPYLNANCGGMFVIWDRVFGTYVEEDPSIPIELGTSFELNFHDPFEANLDYYRRLVFATRHRRGWRNKLALWFESPAVLLAELDALNYDAVPRQQLHLEALAMHDKLYAGAATVVLIGVFAFHRIGFAGNSNAMRLATGVGVMLVMAVIGRQISAAGVADQNDERESVAAK